MRRFTIYIAAFLVTLGFFTLQFENLAHAQKTKQRAFYIETQPDSPILIRDLTATILPVNKYRNLPKVEIKCFFENRSKKSIKSFAYQLPAENDKNYEDFREAGRDSGGLLAGESSEYSTTYTIDGDAVVLRVKEVEFEDGTKWKAKPFNAANARKSAVVKPVPQEPIDANRTKRILTPEWTAPIFADRLTKTIQGKPEIVEGIKIQTKYHEIKTEILDHVENCPPDAETVKMRDEALSKGMIDFTEFDEKVEGYTTYEINGRVFAYAVNYESVDEETEDEIGIGFKNVYVDETGSGTFKLRCSEMDLKSLPQWVKDLAEK